MSTLTSTRRLIVSTLIGLAIIIAIVAAPLYAQYRQVDQGKPTSTLTKGWPMQLCDTSGNCITMVLVGAAYAVPVTVTSGTVQANAGTGTFNVTCISGCGGAPSFTDTGAFTFGTTPIGIIGAVVDTAASHTIADGLAGAPRMSTSRLLYVDLSKSGANTTNFNVTATGTMSVTSGTIGSITMPSLTVTSATVGQMPSLSVTSGTIGQMPSMSVTSGTIGQITMPSLTVTSSTVGLITMPSLTVTSATVGNTVTISPTGTQSINSAQFLGAAVTTANPYINGGRAATDTVAAVANGAAVAQAMDKFGRAVFVFAPQDLWGQTTFTLTATTASSVLAAPGANYRWAITAVYACNTAAAAVRLDFQDGTTAKFPMAWTATAGCCAMPCITHLFNPPFLLTANTDLQVKLSVAVTDMRGAVTAYKTGT